MAEAFTEETLLAAVTGHWGSYGAHADLTRWMIAEVKHLRAALALAVGELSTHGEYTAWTPEMLMNQFLEEARRG